MELEIVPDPDPAERMAIAAALARSGDEAGTSAWWRRGVRENLAEDGGEPAPSYSGSS